MNPFLSVIIPVYNEEKFIEIAINSVLNQPCKDLEIIVINDGSKDNTESVVKNIQKSDERIKYIYKDNSGVSDSRNIGINEAKGKYIAFLDSDDLWVEGVYTDKCKQEITDSECDIAAFAYQMSYADSNQVYMTTWPGDPKGQTGDIAVDNIFTHFCSIFYLKELILKSNVYFPSGHKYLEDYRFQRKVLYLAQNVHRMSDSNKPLFIYRSNPHSACHTADRTEFTIAIMDAFYDLQKFFSEQYISEGRNPVYYNAQQGLLFLRGAREFCYYCKNYKEWKERFIDCNVISTVHNEIINGLSFPTDGKKEIEQLIKSDRIFYYKNRLKNTVHNIRRKIYRFVSFKILKR